VENVKGNKNLGFFF